MSTVPPRATRRIDVTDAREREDYERAFHAAFERATHNRLVRSLWDWDDAGRRLRTRVPYEDQAVWGLPAIPGTVTAGIGVNVRMRQLQGAAFGFRVPEAGEPIVPERRFCEVLTFFVVGRESIQDRFALWREVFRDLRGMGFTHALATTAPKVMPLYRFIGARVLAETRIGDEQRIFLEFDLDRTARGEPSRSTNRAAGP